MLVWECDLPSFAKGGKLVPLDDYMKDTKAFPKGDLIPAVRKYRLSRWETYGLLGATPVKYTIQQDMFDAAHVAYPTSSWTG
jgi:hypothetical protein